MAPVAIDPVPVAALWHERMHADPAHSWFRGVVARVLTALLAARASLGRKRAGPRSRRA